MTTPLPSSRRHFTFFYTDGCERHTVEPIAEEAARRGYPIRFTDQMRERADIGIYCQHACRPNANFSVIMLHDLAQRHDIWPHFWQTEPWNDFDVGLVPGEAWVKRWQMQADFPVARPRLGLFNLGWPKADLVFRNRANFAEAATKLREKLHLRHERSVLYAPSWENDGKQDDFVQALLDLPVNLLLKQAPWSNDYPMVLENIRAMNELHRDYAPNVHIIDPNISIMYCLGLADVLVSDESSVLTEALLLDVPGVAVEDWLIPDRIPSRFAQVPYDYVIKTQRANLRQTVQQVLDAPAAYRDLTEQAKHQQFSNLGLSTKAIIDTLEAATSGQPLPYPPISPQVEQDRLQFLQAEQLVQNGQFNEGMQQIIALAHANTPCWEVFNYLGVLAHQEGKLADATVLLEMAANRAPDPQTPLANLIESYCMQQDREKALPAFNAYMQRTPASPELFQAMQVFMHIVRNPTQKS